MLENIISDKDNRLQLIREFQNCIWDDCDSGELLSTLAYDLDFFEPSAEKRQHDSSYYGEERLLSEVGCVLKLLKVENMN